MTAKDSNAFVTNQILDEAVETIIKGVDHLIKDFRDEVRISFNNVGKRFDKIENDSTWIRDDIKGTKADLSETVSRKEFSHLKEKVDKHLSGVVS